VDDHRHAIAGEVNVELPGIRPGVPGALGGDEGVLGSMKGIAAVGDDQGSPGSTA
jgi:hypothetical protein